MNANDLAEIHQLYSAYCHAADRGQGERFGSCFTPDGRLVTNSGEFVGRARIAEFGVAVPKILPGVRHVLSNIYVEGEGDQAAGSAYLISMSTATGPKMVISGQYDDRLARVDGRWLLAERIVSYDHLPSPKERDAAGVPRAAG